MEKNKSKNIIEFEKINGQIEKLGLKIKYY